MEIAQLEHRIRDVLNKTAPRYMAVLRPLKVVIENYPEDLEEHLDAINNPEDPAAGTRQVPFAREFYVERGDFMEDPPRKFHRLGPGREVRLRYAYFVTCTDVIKDESGNVIELRCTYDPATKGGNAPDGRKVRGTIHWVSARHAVAATVHLYERLFMSVRPGAKGDMVDDLNPASIETLTDCWMEPALAARSEDTTVQFERLGYFCNDRSATPERLVFNRTATLRDSWAKSQNKS